MWKDDESNVKAGRTVHVTGCIKKIYFELK